MTNMEGAAILVPIWIAATDLKLSGDRTEVMLIAVKKIECTSPVMGDHSVNLDCMWET